MKSLRPLAALLPLLALALVAGQCPLPGAVLQYYGSVPGQVEPHTPGAPGVAASSKLQDLLGPAVDLNRVHSLRTYRAGSTPSVVIILVPGFLGGATTFDPLARDLVAASGGAVQVWAVDRRPNQLEDQLGGLHAQAGAENGDLDALFEGAQFYFPDTNAGDPAIFPEPGVDLDLDLDGVFDPQTPLTDALGVSRLPILFTQDDVRSFMAFWGIDLYMRDWKRLVDEARALVGPDGLVLFGGHSQGTGWTARFAAYDFDPGPGVLAGYSLVDGILLLEGGGAGGPSASAPTPAEYDQALLDLQQPGGPDVFLENLTLGGQPVLKLTDLGTVGQVAAVAAFFDPSAPSLIQRTPIFLNSQLGLLLSAPSTNLALAGFFLDDDYSANPAFRATLGFSFNGGNFFSSLFNAYVPQPAAGGALRTWNRFDDPAITDPANTCPPLTTADLNGCALNFTRNPNDDEVTEIDDFLRTQFEHQNGFEWYFADGRVSLDFQFGLDSSSLGDESKLAITQNANVDIPVLGIGGDNGLAPTVSSFDTYFTSIATPAADKMACILPGYAHLDPINARSNLAVGLILDFVDAVSTGTPLTTALTCP